MDFHTMVSSFKRSVLEEKQISELTRDSRKRVKKYIRDGTPGRHTPRLSFENLFGGQDIMRVIIPVGTEEADQATDMFKRIVDRGWKPAFTFKDVVQKMRDIGGREYEQPMELPVLTMKKEVEKVIPKGPRAGEKITNVQKISLGKLVDRFGTDEDKAWWKKNQSSLREMDNVQKYFLNPYLNSFESRAADKPHIVISRHPIDVARMSDFGTTRSCHSEGSSHFSCALDESRGHGMVAYLVRGTDVEEYDLINRINDEEIFGDHHINFDGPEPRARVRIYKLFNPDTDEEFGVAEDRVYGFDVPDFLPTVRQWLRQNQRDMWADEDGNIDEYALGERDFIRIGGEYADVEQGGGHVGDLIMAMFKDTPLEDQADNIFGGVDYRHEDYYDEKASDLLDIANERVSEYVDDGNRSVGDKPVSIYADVEEGWDDIPFFVQGGYTVDFTFKYDDEWDNNENRSIVPDYRSSWQHQRQFSSEIYEVLYDKASIYSTGNEEIESREENNEITISYRDIFEFDDHSMEAVEQLEYLIDNVVEEFANNYDSIHGVIRAHLIEEGYLPEGAFERAAQKFADDNFEGYKNLTVLYDEEKPGDGIEIINKITEPSMSMRSGYGFPFHKVTKVKAGAIGPFSVYAAYQNDLRSPLRRDAINSAIRATFKRLANEAFKHALKQVPLPFDKKFQAEPKNMRDMMPMSFVAELGAPNQSSEIQPAKFDVGLRFSIKIATTTEQEEIDRVEAFVEYVDEHIDVLYNAAARVAEELRDQVVSRLEKNPQVQFEESALREAIKKAVIERLLKEQSEFETRMFQVTLKIQVDPSLGGGIEQKLNRIRAIEGVTVVSHDEPQTMVGREVIEARIKFHPESDALRPGTYVTQVLVPEINSSKLVPGVKVIDIIRGTLKRLDK